MGSIPNDTKQSNEVLHSFNPANDITGHQNETSSTSSSSITSSSLTTSNTSSNIKKKQIVSNNKVTESKGKPKPPAHNNEAPENNGISGTFQAVPARIIESNDNRKYCPQHPHKHPLPPKNKKEIKESTDSRAIHEERLLESSSRQEHMKTS